MAKFRSTKLVRARERIERYLRRVLKEERIYAEYYADESGFMQIHLSVKPRGTPNPPFELDVTSSTHQDPTQMSEVLTALRGYPWQNN